MALLDASGTYRSKKDTKFKQHKHIFYGRELTLQGYEAMALRHLVEVMGVKPKDIVTECENDFAKTLGIRYKYNGEWRTYLPDAYVISKRTIIECKSVHTLGLLGNKKRGWSMTCAKARAAREKGYDVILLLMRDDGSRIKMPKGWYDMKKAQVVEALSAELFNTSKSVKLF